MRSTRWTSTPLECRYSSRNRVLALSAYVIIEMRDRDGEVPGRRGVEPSLVNPADEPLDAGKLRDVVRLPPNDNACGEQSDPNPHIALRHAPQMYGCPDRRSYQNVSRETFLMVWTASPQRHQSAKAWPPERHKEGDRP